MSEERGRPEPEEELDPDELGPEDPDADPEPEETDEPDGDEPDGEPEPEPERATRQPRGNRDFGNLRAQNRELRDRLSRLEGQLQARPVQPQRPLVDPAVEEQQFFESLALMAPDQQSRALQQRIEGRVSQQILQTRLETADMIDRQNFRDLQRDYPAAKRLASRVEELLASERQNGRNTPREVIFKYLVGEEALSRSRREGERQRNAGRRRIAAQTTRPGSSRSTVANGAARRGDPMNDDEAYLAMFGNRPLGNG